jgi:RNA polymerase sigma-70 factor (ECF subfamily)
VEAREQLDERCREESPGTLGDVLYANPAKPRIPETEWAGLVASVAGGDPLALHDLYDRAHRMVFTLAVRITCSRETAEEVTLDVFHDVWRRAAAYDPANGTVLGWIMNQARSRAIDRLRFEQRKKRVDPGAGDSTQTPGAADPRDLLDLKQQGQALRAALAMLTRDERQAIESAFFSGLTHAEVAEQLDQPLGTIKTRIRSGLQKLRLAMGEEARKS